jgi:hypothetical protein
MCFLKSLKGVALQDWKRYPDITEKLNNNNNVNRISDYRNE